MYGICLFSLSFLPEPVVDTHHIIAFNQINATEGCEWRRRKKNAPGCAGFFFFFSWKRDSVSFGAAS